MKTFTYFLLTILTAIFLTTYAVSQGQKECSDTEMKAEVPELTEFHDIIYKVWHTGWANKDIKLLTELLPDIEQGRDNIIKAELPGILRDKKQIWQENTDKLISIIADYKNAASPADSGKLLAAAENLHSQFEKLVRIIRPVSKEIEDFHTVLYKLYHYYMPEDNQENVKSSIIELKEKMEALNKAKLPERLQSKEKSFVSARVKLSKSVTDLNKSLKKYKRESVYKKIESVHSDYQALEKIFE